METQLLLLSVATASFGFLIWYTISSSLQAPICLQIQYDINSPYMNRILRRRIWLFVIYFVIPVWLLGSQKLFGDLSLADIGIHFTWNQTATIWVVGLIPLVIIHAIFNTKRDGSLSEYPEIRVTLWQRNIFILSTLTWVLQIFAMEFLFRGLLLQSLRSFVSDITAVIISTGIYALTLYFKRNRLSIISIPYGIVACYIVITTNSLLPVIIIHLADALITEWLSIKNHPEIKAF